MKILIAGNWHSSLHEEPVYHAFKELGHEPVRFKWCTYFQPKGWAKRILYPLARAQLKYNAGPLVGRSNRDLVEAVLKERPDMVFVYRGILIYPETLRRIKRALPHTILVGYNNDDPFSPRYPKWKWRHFIASIPEYDLTLVYRLHNVEDFRAAGAKRVELLRSWYIPETNRPVTLTNEERKKYECDVVFIGHYEEDGREKYLEEVVRRGWNLKIFGHNEGWQKVLLGSDLLRRYYPIKTLWGDDYNRALCGAKVALCFFSKLNRDTYTRRCFEIPAAGTMLLSEYSDDLASLFVEGQEADYFRTPEELIKKLEIYLGDEQALKRVVDGGHQKVIAAGHDVKSRMVQVLDWVK
ncbi:MAG: glycosyltransferase [Gallionella sp.]|nr:glycosyltransferase [Gallionella sp.]